MKLITAIIQPHRLEEVKKELYKAEVNFSYHFRKKIQKTIEKE